MTAKLDGRTQSVLLADLLRRATATLSGRGDGAPPGALAKAILTVAARLEEEVTLRLARVPDKQANNFYAAMGLGRDPARPASVPVAFRLAAPSPDGITAPAGTRLTGEAGGKPVVFETRQGIVLANARIAAVVGVDVTADRIFLPPLGIVDAALPHPGAVARATASAAGAGATQIQINPATDLTAGMEIAIGTGDAIRNYGIAEVQNDLVTIEPALATAVGAGTPVVVVDRFAPFAAAARDRQGHALYLGHKTILNVPSAVNLIVSGLDEMPAAATWSWWGQIGDADPAWQPLTAATGATAEAGQIVLAKQEGKPAQTAIDGRDNLWLRALLPGASDAMFSGEDILIGVAADPDAPSVAYEAIAVTTPVVTNQPYYPFGREPRIYDAFYVGCAEAFSKPGAQVTLDFRLGGADLGPIATVSDGTAVEMFAVGSDGLLYRADFRTTPPRFQPVPPPRAGTDIRTLPPQAPVSAMLVDGMVRVAVGDKGAVQVAAIPFDVPMTAERIVWATLAGPADDKERAYAKLFVSVVGSAPSVHALADGTIRAWLWDGNAWALQTDVGDPAEDLVPIENVAGAALIIAPENGERTVLVKWPRMIALERLDTIAVADLPAAERTAWQAPRDSGGATIVYLAGFDPVPAGSATGKLRIVRLGEGAQGHDLVSTDLSGLIGPVHFEPVGGNGVPTLLVAAGGARRIALRDGALVELDDLAGLDARRDGKSGFVRAGNLLAVQSSDEGLVYRIDPPRFGPTDPLVLSGQARFVLPAASVPDAASHVVLGGAPDGPAYALAAASNGDRLLNPIGGAGTPDAHASAPAFFSYAGGLAPLSIDTSIDLGDPTLSGTIDLLATDGAQAGIWRLEEVSPAQTPPRWEIPDDFPFAAGAMDVRYRPMRAETAPVATWQLLDYFQPDDISPLSAALAITPLRVAFGTMRVDRITLFASTPLVRLDHAAISGGEVTLVAEDGPWQTLGLSQPANPALSWEYWNGVSWWALDGGNLQDRTADLLVSDTVTFAVPANLAETDVGGRRNHWIRARLVGGDYGEARTTVTVTDLGGGKTQQELTRDLSAIRAPYVVALDLTYRLTSLERPEMVLAADNLGVIDQTAANAAGLPVPIYPPVSTLMDPAPVRKVVAPDYEEACEPPCMPPAEPEPPVVPDPCGADTTDPAASSRAFLIGFDGPVVATPLTLYVDAVPTGAVTPLVAHRLADGRFQPVRVISDESYGLNEPGTISLDMSAAPDRVTMFGTTAYWLRLQPDPAASGGVWSPDVRGLYLNAVAAWSIESRHDEMIGASGGTPGQAFRLAEAPVATNSLVLRVRETLSVEEAAMADVLPVAGAGLDGPWVLWREVASFDGAGPLDRVYMLDLESGMITFGDAQHGAIPPLGATIMAIGYAHVTGAAANGVTAGAVLQLLSPIAGVEKVTALDLAAGGIDVETAESARMRAQAKMRHGARILSTADIEDFVRASWPGLAQVRAVAAPAGTTLIVVPGDGAGQPAPAVLRAIGAAVGEISSYGIAAPGRLKVIGPRLLPIAIRVTFIPDAPARFADLAEQTKRLLRAFLDPATGGHDGQGWPLGAAPDEVDVSAALEPLAAGGVVEEIVILRADRDPPEPMPARLPADALVTLATDAVTMALLVDETA